MEGLGDVLFNLAAWLGLLNQTSADTGTQTLRRARAGGIGLIAIGLVTLTAMGIDVAGIETAPDAFTPLAMVPIRVALLIPAAIGLIGLVLLIWTSVQIARIQEGYF